MHGTSVVRHQNSIVSLYITSWQTSLKLYDGEQMMLILLPLETPKSSDQELLQGQSQLKI